MLALRLAPEATAAWNDTPVPMSHDRDIEIIDHAPIPMRDGCELAARLWLPAGARDTPVPAILEYIPYRLRDYRAARDARDHGFFARHGYAGVRVDLRGSGDSDGVLDDEYLPAELEDGVEVIEWIARQPWCSGRVGMIGISWGGFNGLQIAAMQPPALGAVVTVCSSDDRYADDVHYMGGCLLNDNLSWASVMLSYNACPPDPAVVGERWRDMWHERLEAGRPWLHEWLQHQRRDAYWRHASLCEDYAAIRCPVFAVGGWADGYCNTVFRLMAHLDVPRKGLVGAWNHKYPHTGGPGPAIDFLGECLRWFDRWLRDRDNGADAGPRLRAWLQDGVSPLSDDRPGRWVAEDAWPSPRIEPRRLPLSPEGLAMEENDAQPAAKLSIRSPLSVGLFGGKWCSYSESTDFPTDQRLEDGGSLVFDSPVLDEAIEILGAPSIALRISADQDQAMVAVRLSDVAPDGTVTLVTFGLLNLNHRDNHERWEALTPGEPVDVRVGLNHIGQRFERGHRIRVAVSSSYWPMAWPAPRPATLTIDTEASALYLPVRPPRAEDANLPDLGSPRMAPAPSMTPLTEPLRDWQVHFNLGTNEAVLTVIDHDGRFRLDDTGVTLDYEVDERYSYANDDYDTVRGEVVNTRRLERGDWLVTVRTRTVLTSDARNYYLHAQVEAWEAQERVFARHWDEVVPRDG